MSLRATLRAKRGVKSDTKGTEATLGETDRPLSDVHRHSSQHRLSPEEGEQRGSSKKNNGGCLPSPFSLKNAWCTIMRAQAPDTQPCSLIFPQDEGPSRVFKLR